jgi:hypothetical protein
MRKGSHFTKEQLERIIEANRRLEKREQCRLSKLGDKNPSKRPEVREKIGSTLRIRYSNGEKKPTCFWKGKKFTKEHRLNMAKKGDKNYFWQGGKFKDSYPEEFNNYLKELIRERDGVCQLCMGLDENKELAVHHIDYDKENNSLNNLISLCNSCHAKTHTNRIFWINKLTYLMGRKQ